MGGCICVCVTSTLILPLLILQPWKMKSFPWSFRKVVAESATSWNLTAAVVKSTCFVIGYNSPCCPVVANANVSKWHIVCLQEEEIVTAQVIGAVGRLVQCRKENKKAESKIYAVIWYLACSIFVKTAVTNCMTVWQFLKDETLKTSFLLSVG